MKQHSVRHSPAPLRGDLGQVLVDQVLEAGLRAGSPGHREGEARGETTILVLEEEAVEAEAEEAWVHQAGLGLEGADPEGGQVVAIQVGWGQVEGELGGVEIASSLRMTPSRTWWSTT